MSQSGFRANVKDVEQTRKTLQKLAAQWTGHTHTGAEVSNTPAGSIAATTVQAALNELDSEKSAVGHGHAGTEITNTPAGNIAATNVQTALNELDTDKANKVADATTGNFAALDVNGDLVDSGYNSSNISSTGNHKNHGFADRTTSTMSFNATNRMFTIATT